MSEHARSMPAIYVADSDLGRGAFALRSFSRGEKILMFTGRTISLSEAIALGEKESNPMQIAEGSYLDIEAPGVFLNHSCAPNTRDRRSADFDRAARHQGRRGTSFRLFHDHG